MVAYDPTVVQEFANRLYREARSVQVVWPLLGFLAGFILVGSMASRTDATAVLLVGGVGAILGYAASRSRAFVLRLEAQKALCQVRIEENTRAQAAGAPRTAAGA